MEFRTGEQVIVNVPSDNLHRSHATIVGFVRNLRMADMSIWRIQINNTGKIINAANTCLVKKYKGK